MYLLYFYLRNFGNNVRQLIDGQHAILSKIKRLVIVRLHELEDTCYAVIDIAERSCLVAIPPNINFRVASQFCYGNFATQSRRNLLASTRPCTCWPKNIVEARDARLQSILFVVVHSESLDDQLLPTVCILRVRGIGILFLERDNVGLHLTVFGIDTRGRCEQKTVHAVYVSCFKAMDVHEQVVVQDLRVVGGNKPHSSHVGRQGIDLIHTARGLQAIIPAPQVEQLEFVSVLWAELRVLDVHSAYPVARFLQVCDQMMADETTGTGDKDSCSVRHCFSPSFASSWCRKTSTE